MGVATRWNINYFSAIKYKYCQKFQTLRTLKRTIPSESQFELGHSKAHTPKHISLSHTAFAAFKLVYHVGKQC